MYIFKLGTNLGEFVFIDISYEVNVDTLGPDSAIPCDADMNLNQDDCLLRKMTKNLTEKFGCTIPYLPDQAGEPVCDPEVKTHYFARFQTKEAF